MMRIAGGDAVSQMYSRNGMAVSEEVMQKARESLGLDKPFFVQYFSWLFGMLRGDMGTSYVSGKEVFSTFASKLPATLLLTLMSIVVTVAISIPLGIWSAVKHNKATDYVIRVLSFIGNSLPNFFVALLLMLAFSIRLKWFPVMSTGTSVKSAVLPTLTLGVSLAS